MAGFWSRANAGAGLAAYAWTMMGVELYLHGAPLPEGRIAGWRYFGGWSWGRAVVASCRGGACGDRPRAPGDARRAAFASRRSGPGGRRALASLPGGHLAGVIVV